MICGMRRFVRMVAILSIFSSYAQYARGNRLADSGKQGTHCSPLPGNKCEPMLRKWKDRGCITADEMLYGLEIRPMRVPQCADPDGTWLFNSWCYCSCFAKGTRILVEDTENSVEKWVAVEDVALNVDRYKLLVPAADARMGQMSYEKLEIANWTEGPEANPLVVIKGSNGHELVITGNHRVVLADGSLVEASNIKVGDSLVDPSGSVINVIKLDMRVETESVYNFLTIGVASHSHSHMMFAEGFIVGDLLWENSPEEEVNAVTFPK